MPSDRFSIVVVEDNPADAEMLRIALAQTSVPLDIILFDSAEAVSQYLGIGCSPSNAVNCDLLLLDLNLPRISGFEILQRIRHASHLDGLQVVILSGSTNPDDVTRCYRLGADSYVCKPTDLEGILATGQQLIERFYKTVKVGESTAAHS